MSTLQFLMTPRQLSKHATTDKAKSDVAFQWLSSVVIDRYFANYTVILTDTVLLTTTRSSSRKYDADIRRKSGDPTRGVIRAPAR